MQEEAVEIVTSQVYKYLELIDLKPEVREIQDVEHLKDQELRLKYCRQTWWQYDLRFPSAQILNIN